MAKGAKPSVKVGDNFTSKSGEPYEVIEYKAAKMGVTIRFTSTGNTMLCSAKEVKNGSVKNVLQKSVYNVACFGIGQYKAKVSGKFTPEYQVWIGMMTRVYDPKAYVKHPTYRSASVCEEWLNFQNFAKWCQGKIGFMSAEANGRAYHLDKDILVPNNLVYGPDACCFLPNHINVALKGRQLDKTAELPAGVYWHNASNSYVAQVQMNGKNKHLGCFQTVDEARKTYRKEKTAYLCSLAERYKDVLCDSAYNALINIDLDERTEYEYA